MSTVCNQVICVEDYGATCDSVTDDAQALIAANAAAAVANAPLFIPGAMYIGTVVTVTAPLVDTCAAMFTTSSLVTIDNGKPLRPEWWGNGTRTVRAAIDALPATGGVVDLAAKTYAPNGWFYGFGEPGQAITKPNVKLRGAQMPTFANDMRSLQGGTIIQGMVLAYADNIQLENLGVDVGANVVDAFYGGNTQNGVTEGLLCTFPDYATRDANALRVGARLHNVVALAHSPSAQVHAIIAGEGYDQVICTGDVIGAYGLHGVVLKCSGVRAESLTAFCTGSTGVIVKSDTATTTFATDIQIGRIYSRAQGPRGCAPYLSALNVQEYGLLINPFCKAVDVVQIGEIITEGARFGIGQSASGPYSASSIKIGRAVVDQQGVTGAPLALSLDETYTGQSMVRWDIEHLEARNTHTGASFDFCNNAAQNQHCHIGHLSVTNVVTAVEVAGSACVSIGTVTTDNCTGAIYDIKDAAKLSVGMLFQDANTPAVYSAPPALINGWVQFAGADVFGVDLLGGRINLRGLIRPGANNIFCTLPAWARPKTSKRFMVQGYNGLAQSAVPLVIDAATGNCVINEVASGVANATSWLSLSGVTWEQQA